jgi:hypothetical protein
MFDTPLYIVVDCRVNMKIRSFLRANTLRSITLAMGARAGTSSPATATRRQGILGTIGN